MKQFSIHINSDGDADQSAFSGKKFNNRMVGHKFGGWQGFLWLLLPSTVISCLALYAGFTWGLVILAGLISLPIVYFLVVKPLFGILVYMIMAFSILWLYRMGVEFPLGTLMDGMLVFFVLGLFIQMRVKRDWNYFNNAISVLLLIWIMYNVFEVVNPSAESRLAWLYTIRTMALITSIYFIFLYQIRTKRFLKTILKGWLLIALFGALYALKQEYIGFFPFEEKYLEDPTIASLFFQAGHWRKFSIFSDPPTFAFNMVIAAILCIAILTGPVKTYQKIMLGLLAFLFLYVALFSGTRGAYPLIPAAFLLMAVLKFNKKILFATGFIMGLFAFLILLPTSDPNLLRFQSAFKPNQDASYLVRVQNQERIKPYIYTHPIGGGAGSTGTWGRRFAPNSFLAKFPPDSGYVRVAVELGWIGLFIFSALMLTILITGIKNYNKIRDPELKSYALGMVMIVFALNIGNFPQEALVQYPTNVLFYLAVALIWATYKIDQQQKVEQDAKP